MTDLRTVLFAAAVFFSGNTLLCAADRMPLWPEWKMPDAQPQQIAAFLQEQQAPGFNPDEHRLPYIEWMPPPAKPNGVCMILISDGFRDVLGEDARHGNRMRPPYACASRSYFPEDRKSGNRKLYVDGARLGVHEPQEVQQVILSYYRKMKETVQ